MRSSSSSTVIARPRGIRELIALLLVWLGAALPLTPARAAPSASVWLIVPGVRAGPITATTSVADLIRTFGRANIQETDVWFGENEARPGAVIYPGDPIRRAELIWKEPRRKRFPDVFFVAGALYRPTYKSLWHTSQGITVGTTLEEVERLNGRPFLLNAFSWDGEGVVMSWRGGRMEKALEKLMLKFEPSHPDPTKAVRKADLDTLSGPPGTKLRSDYWVLRKLMVRVFQMAISF